MVHSISNLKHQPSLEAVNKQVQSGTLKLELLILSKTLQVHSSFFITMSIFIGTVWLICLLTRTVVSWDGEVNTIQETIIKHNDAAIFSTLTSCQQIAKTQQIPPRAVFVKSPFSGLSKMSNCFIFDASQRMNDLFTSQITYCLSRRSCLSMKRFSIRVLLFHVSIRKSLQSGKRAVLSIFLQRVKCTHHANSPCSVTMKYSPNSVFLSLYAAFFHRRWK